MAESHIRSLTLADQALINLAARLVINVYQPPEDVRLLLETIRDLLPEANRQNPMIGELALACDALLLARGPHGMNADGWNAWAHAIQCLRNALDQVFAWRGALAYAAMRRDVAPGDAA